MATNSVQVLIVEDEGIVALNLAEGLRMDGFEVAGIADNAAEALDLYNNNTVDIVLMDINIIGETDGIDLATAIIAIRPVPIIFLTAFTDAATVERVKKVCPAAFLTKPYHINNVRIAIELALNNFAVAQPPGGAKLVSMPGATLKETPNADTILQLEGHIFIKSNYRFVKLALTDLLYAEADSNHVHLHTKSTKFTLRLSLNALLEKIHYNRMIRIHRSYAVNMDAIEAFNEQDVFIGNKELPIGSSYKEEFLHRFQFR